MLALQSNRLSFIDRNSYRSYNVIMKTNIIQIGNSKGVRIPKPLLDQLKFEQTVEFEITPEGLLVRPIRQTENKIPRKDWAEKFQAALAKDGGDDSPEFADWNQTSLTEFDEKEW